MEEVGWNWELSTKEGCFVEEVGWNRELSTKRGCFVEEDGWNWELSTKGGCFVEERRPEEGGEDCLGCRPLGKNAVRWRKMQSGIEQCGDDVKMIGR